MNSGRKNPKRGLADEPLHDSPVGADLDVLQWSCPALLSDFSCLYQKPVSIGTCPISQPLTTALSAHWCQRALFIVDCIYTATATILSFRSVYNTGEIRDFPCRNSSSKACWAHHAKFIKRFIWSNLKNVYSIFINFLRWKNMVPILNNPKIKTKKIKYC